MRMVMLGAALAAAPAGAQVATPRSEAALGVLDHGVNFPKGELPPGFFYAGTEERGTVDVQLMWRSRPLGVALKPRLTAKLMVNTGGRTSFAAVGAEWRQHVLGGRLYGQIGMGLAVHDGRLTEVDPFAPGLTSAERDRLYDIYANRTAFGSAVLFNPNLSVGVRLSPRVALEAVWEHYSHARLFSRQNPGIDMLGGRLVLGLGR
jgi:lipid A 3-O-deacylase